MESKEGIFGSNISETDVRHNRDSFKSDDKEADARVLSVDKVTVEKIVLDSSNGSREVLLTKNEISKKLSLSSETRSNVVKCAKDERQKSASNGRFRVSVQEDTFASKSKGSKVSTIVSSSQSRLPIPKSRKINNISTSSEETRIKPIRFAKNPSIGSIAIEGLNSTNAIVKKNSTVPPKVPEKSITKNEHNSSLITTQVSFTKAEPSEDLLSKGEKVIDEIVTEVKQEQAEEELFEAEDVAGDKKDDGSVNSAEIDVHNETFRASNVNCKRESAEIKGDVESGGGDARSDRDVRDRLEKSQATIDDLQKNLRTKIHASTAQSYKEKLLGFQANYALKPPIIAESNCSERLTSGFDKDFLKRHNLDKRLKIEEKRLLETDLDYTSDNDRASETGERSSSKIDVKRKYSEKVTEVEKRWSGEFLDNHLQRNSSESSKSSYVEEFGSVSSRESIVEDREARLFFDRKHPEAKFTERRTLIADSKRRTSEEILENSTVSTVDSDSCLEDRIKAVDEDIAVANEEDEIQTDDGSDRAYGDEEDKDCVRNKEVETNTILTTTAIVHEDLSLRKENIRSDVINVTSDTNSNEVKNNCKKNIEEARNEIFLADGTNLLTEKKNDKTSHSFVLVNSKESIDPTTFVVRNCSGKDGYANLIKEFTMEAGSSKVKKEEKQKKKLGFRRLLPAIFSPKDSRKDYKKKEQKERRRYDERHFARYQQNGNYTRSPDTMNLNEDIKRNVKLDNSLNGSIIEERLDEIKRELFPEQGPITSTPDHFLQTDDTRLLRERTRGQRSYTVDSSLSSIAPDEKWLERSGQFGVSPDIRKYEQRQRREEQDSRRYGHLERKHSLQEPNHGTRTYLFQRNHGASGRISAPPGERYLRSRAIHPVDRPLPEIPQSRIELSNYENYQDSVDQLCNNLSGFDVADNVDYRSQSGLYQNDRSLEAGLIHNSPQSVPAQVKITRQPIVNQNQRAPLIGRSPKYPSSGSSQKSGDYADSSCTPNSSQKSEFSPSSSKSGEYYLNSPRSSARTSPADRPLFEDARERIYENEGQTTPQPSGNYIEEHVYDETPSSPCREEHFANTEASDCITENSPEKKDDLVFEQKCSSNQQSPSKNCSFQYCEDSENARTECSTREIEKSREDCLKNYENADANLKNDSLACNQAERSSIQSASPSKPGMPMSPSAGSRTRRSQPDDQILIASPKRELICQSRVSRPLNETRFCDAESPVPIADSRDSISGIVPIEVRNQYGGQNSSAMGMARSTGQMNVLSCSFSKGISRPEPIYGYRGQPSPSRGNAVTLETREGGRESEQLSPSDSYGSTKPCRDIDERIARVQGRNSTSQSPQSCASETKKILNEPGRRVARSPIREPNAAQDICQQRRHDAVQPQRTPFTEVASSPTTSQEKMYISASSLQREPIYEQRQRQLQSQQQPRQGQELYVQRVADTTCGQQSHPTCGLLSPSKQETRQHLEAFYWQQKALEAHRKSAVPVANSGPRQIAPKIDLPEMREAVYWQQLKRLDEEQQRRIYEQNTMEDGLCETYHKTRTGSPMISTALPNQTFNSNITALGPAIHGDGSYWSNVQQRLKMSPTGKPPLRQAQKGQNQPVLIVRPQQALRDRQEMSMKSINPRDPAGHDAQRSKSASPHFHRGDIERTSLHATYRKPVADRRTGTASPARKLEIGIYEEDSNDSEGRPRPHPIFKRGSLIGGESVDYGSTGPKRVSFSNQPNIGPDLATGNWPTKRGTAPEPPTRRHRSEDSTSDTDSVFLHQDRHDGTQDASYVTRNAGPSSRCRSDGSCSEQEYDANKPLPPLPKDSLIISRRGNRNYVCHDARWNNEEQRGCRRKRSGESFILFLRKINVYWAC